MKSVREDVQFVKLLKESIEKIYEGVEDEEDENDKIKDDDIMSCESTHETDEPEDVKSKLAQFERRSTRSLRSQANTSQTDGDDDVIYEKETSKLKKDNDKIVYENQQEWLTCFSECNSIEDLLLLISNQQIYFDSHGLFKVNALKSLESKINDYNSTKSFDDLKQVLIEMFDSISHNSFVGKILTTG